MAPKGKTFKLRLLSHSRMINQTRMMFNSWVLRKKIYWVDWKNMESKISEITQNTARISKAIDDNSSVQLSIQSKNCRCPPKQRLTRRRQTLLSYVLKFLRVWELKSRHGTSMWLIEFQQEPKMAAEEGSSPLYVNLPVVWVRDVVLFKTRNCNLLLPTTFGLNPEDELKISIFSYLTPRLQELFYLAKSVKEQDNYK